MSEDLLPIPSSCVAEPDGIWISVSDLARAKGVEKSSISRRIKRLEDQNLIETRPGFGGQKLVKLAAYDRATGVATDAIREANGASRGAAKAGAAKGSGLAAQQARRVSYQADIAEMELAERRGRLLRAESVRLVTAQAAETIASEIRRLPTYADDLAGAVSRGGVASAKEWLRAIASEITDRIAERFRPIGLADAVPDEPWLPSPERVAEIDADTAEAWRRFDADRQREAD